MMCAMKNLRAELLAAVLTLVAGPVFAASDDFTDTNGTALATHNSNWGDLSTADNVAGMEIQSNTAVGVSPASASEGARYTTSSSLTSIVTTAALTSTSSFRIGLAVRADGTNSGYSVEIYDSGATGNWNYIIWRKNGAYQDESSITGVTRNASYEFKLVSTDNAGDVDLELFQDDVSIATLTDSTSPITSANNPGFFVRNTFDNIVDSWSDGDTGGSTPMPVIIQQH